MILSKLTAFLGREHDFVVQTKTKNGPEIKTYRFPSVDRGCVHNEYIVFITIGMAQRDLPNDPYDKRIEMSLLLRPEYGGEPEADMAGAILNWMANFSFSGEASIEHGGIFNWGNPFINDCELSNFYLSCFPFGEEFQEYYSVLKDILGVTEVFNLIPISEKEANYAGKRGVEALLKLMEKKELNPDFNFFRKSLV